MHTSGNPTSPARAVIERLLQVTNDHDLDALVACFAPDYVNQTPVHPLRGFTGQEQVARNWSQIFAAVPDLVAEVSGMAEVPASADHAAMIWSEWQMSGNRGDGTAHLMRGVIIFTVSGDQISAARFFLEPVETTTGTVDAAVASQLAAQS